VVRVLVAPLGEDQSGIRHRLDPVHASHGSLALASKWAASPVERTTPSFRSGGLARLRLLVLSGGLRVSAFFACIVSASG